MRRLGTVLVAGLTLALSVGASAAAAAESPLRVVGLHVDGGDSWRAANNYFRLKWSPVVPTTDGATVAAVHFEAIGPTGSVAIAATQIPWEVSEIDQIVLPGGNGEFVATVWLEDTLGRLSPRASAILRLDQARPGDVMPVAPAGWLTGGERVLVSRPAPPLPISGIGGYALSFDRVPEGSPCVAADRCTDPETDLRGVDADSLTLPTLPDGISYVHAVAVSGSGLRSTRIGSAAIHVDATPPQTALNGAPEGWARDPVRVLAKSVDPFSGMSPEGSGEPITAVSVDGTVPSIGHGDTATAIVAGDGIHHVTYYARDAAGNVDDGEGANPPPSAVPVRIDGSAPLVAFANSRDPANPELIEALVIDVLSGPSPARGSIGVRPSGSRRQFQPLPTAVSGNRLLARWDSDSFAAGTYEFQAGGFDVAGNSAASGRRLNGTKLVLANPLKTATALVAGFGGRRLVWHRCSGPPGRRHCRREAIESYELRPGSRSVPFGRGVPFSGRLASASGSPLVGQQVQVVETFDPGAVPAQRVTTVETGGDGRFTAHLRPGPSRLVEAVFAGTRTVSLASARQVGLEVETGVRMRGSSARAKVGGAPVVFGGQLDSLGTAIPPGGRAVELQFRLPGRPWAEFRTVQTDARGRFRYPYAFSDDDSAGVRFQFRAFVPAQDGWPYEPGTSRAVFVTGY